MSSTPQPNHHPKALSQSRREMLAEKLRSKRHPPFHGLASYIGLLADTIGGMVRAEGPIEAEGFRTATEFMKRPIEHIAPSEIAQAMLFLVEDQFSIFEEAAPTAVARLFGIERLHSESANVIRKVVEDLVSKGARNSTIQVQFNKQMDPLTITNSTFVFSISGGGVIPGAVSVAPDARSATFTPQSVLSASTVYVVQLNGGATDLVGQGLASYHREMIAALDFFTVPTVTFKLLYCFFVIEHRAL